MYTLIKSRVLVILGERELVRLLHHHIGLLCLHGLLHQTHECAIGVSQQEHALVVSILEWGYSRNLLLEVVDRSLELGTSL